MEKIRKSISLILAALMILACPGMAFAAEQGSVDASANDRAAVTEAAASEEISKNAEQSVQSEEMSEPETEDYASEPENTGETGSPDPDPTKVTMARSVEDLAQKSEIASDNDAFFTIDVSKNKISDDFATEEIEQDVKDIVQGEGSVSTRQSEVADTLQESGYYSTVENGKSKVDVTSRFAYQRLRLASDKKKEINAYGASQAVYYDGYYFLSYDSMEATKLAYDALGAEYGDDAVIVDRPVKLQSSEDWGEVYMGLDLEKNRIGELPSDSKETVKVAVVDTGINSDHTFFKGKTIIKCRDFVNNDDDPADDEGHGTSVAGIISQSTPDNVQIMVYKALDSKGEGSLLNVFTAVQSANEAGADIVNLSLGALFDDNDPEDVKYYNAIKAYDTLWESFSALVVCASGNESADCDEDYFEVPGEFDNTVCVGAIDINEYRCGFSNYGNKLDFVAPGKNNSVADYSTNNKTISGSGTSFASPYVAAVAACFKSVNPDHNKQQLIDDLKSAAYDLGEKGKDREYGYGCPRFSFFNEVVVAEKDLSLNSALHIDVESATYTGAELRPKTTVKLFWNTLTEGKDYTIEFSNNINAGKGKVTITGIGSYYGSVSRTFTINPKSIDPTVSLSQTAFTYDGKAKTPGVTVKDGSKTLTNGTDYSVTYSNNVNAGTGYAAVTLKGNYRGTASAAFSIAVRSAPKTDPYLDNSLKKAAIKKPGRAKKAITVKWKKQTGKTYGSRVTGYQVQIATNPGFTQNVKWASVKGYKKSSKKISKLKRKTRYYVRVRTYMNRGGKKYYSAWSSVRSAKTK